MKAQILVGNRTILTVICLEESYGHLEMHGKQYLLILGTSYPTTNLPS